MGELLKPFLISFILSQFLKIFYLKKRVRRIELPTQPWEGYVLPLNYTRLVQFYQIFKLKKAVRESESENVIYWFYSYNTAATIFSNTTLI